MYSFLRFPNFKKRALTLSYDDGVIFDKRLIDILDANGIKATFNINSLCFGSGRRMSAEEAVALYKNSVHEVAIHGEQHFSLDELPDTLIVQDARNDRIALEKLFGGVIRGMAYANGSCSERVGNVLRTCGVVYSRTTKSTEAFTIPEDFIFWHPTAHHKNPRLNELLDAFLDDTPARHCFHDRPRLFYLWGHSYEFNDNDNWEIIEEFAKRAGGRDDVWYATNIEIYDYVQAYNSLVYSADGTSIYNPSAIDVYTNYFGHQVMIPAGKTVEGVGIVRK